MKRGESGGLSLRPLGFVVFAAVVLSSEVRAASITVEDPYVRFTTTSNAAGFMVLSNDGDRAVKLTRAVCARSRAAELHTHVERDGVMSMRPVPYVEIPAAGRRNFSPGGFHVMLLGLTEVLREGETIPIRLEFDDGTGLDVLYVVRRGEVPEQTHTHGHGHEHHLADMIPPAGIMGAHMHAPGSWLLDYRLMVMEMNRIQDGSHDVSPEQVLFGIYRRPRVQMPMTGLSPPSPFLPAARIEQNEFRYMSVGEKMSMEMQMLSAMYQFSENSMFMLMVPYIQNRMTMLANNFERANMTTKGVGDISFTALFRVLRIESHEAFLGAGIAAGTGSMDEMAWMPQMGRSQAAYAMQPGSGSESVLLQASYTGRKGSASWGAQFDGTVRASKNENNYRAGNRWVGSAWTAFRIFDWLSFSVRVQNQYLENVSGQDPSLDPAMDPGNDPALQGGHRSDVFLGCSMIATGGPFRGSRLFLEVGKPVRQHLHGPQMAVTNLFHFGIQFPL